MRSRAAPRTKPPEARRAELMNAAQRLFLRHGVAATSIEEITAAAGVAKGTFYLYFNSKEDIRAALGKRFAQGLLAVIDAAIADVPATDWPGKLGAWARGAVAAYLDAIRLHDVLFHEAHPPNRDGATDNIIVDRLAALLADGRAAGAWSAPDPRLTALFLFSGLHGVVDAAHSGRKRVDRDALSERVERLCFRAVIG
jgi:AcrR family transcriptional regulator